MTAQAWGRRALGALVLVLSLAPLFRLLDRPGTGQFGEGTWRLAESNLGTSWLGIGIALGLGVVLAILVPAGRLRGALDGLGRSTGRVSPGWWSAAMGLLSFGLALAASLLLYRGLPTLVDGMTSLLHARFLAAGLEAGPIPDPAAAWLVPNGVLTAQGWVSQYPPMHPLLQAFGLRVGMPWLVGPALTGVLAWSTSLAAHRLFERDQGAAKLGSLLVAVSPFIVLLGGGYLSHVSAVAFASVTLLAALKARDGSWVWAVVSGVAMGVMVTSRPWVGLLLGSAFTAGVWIAAAVEDPQRHISRLWSRLGGAFLGGAPIAIAWGVYNARFFGHPLRLGYTEAFGETHRLGFHGDPWGNYYGPLEALGYTSAGLLGLGVHALEMSLPLVPFVAAYLILARALPRGAGIVVAWAVLPVLGNVFYWHHGFHLGPRMLYEAAPGWLLLGALGVMALARPVDEEGSAEGPDDRPSGGRPSLRYVALLGVLASVPAALYFVPMRVATYAWSPDMVPRVTAPSPPGTGEALVFVHGSWAERIAARLQAGGFALDSLETGLRRNDICSFHRWAEVRLGGTADPALPPPRVDFESLPGFPADLEPVMLSPGNRVQIDQQAPWTAECQREAAADRGGVISLVPLVWQGDLPGVERGLPMFVRDLGPAANQSVMALYPDRPPYMFYEPRPDRAPLLVPYAEAEPVIWGVEVPQR